MKKVDVAVIGAGFSGLSAAHALRDNNADVLVLEAQDIPGGRVKTVVLDDGLAYERGGQFYSRDMTQIAGLVEKYGLTRRNVRKKPGVVAILQGKRKIIENDFLEARFLEAILAAEPDLPGSLGDWVESLGLDSENIAMIKSGCEEIMGRPIEDFSYRSVRELLSKVGDLENSMEYCCLEGLGTLAGLLAKDLADGFIASAPVTEIDRKHGLFELTTPKGSFLAKNVVYAASPVVLHQIDWLAPQDQWIKGLPKRFVAGRMRKIVLRYETIFWSGSDYGWLGQTDNPSGLSVMDVSDPSGRLCMLAVFCGGTAAKALEGLSDEEVLLKVMGIIEPMLGPKVRQPIKVVQTDWSDHPWVGGAYATWPRPWDDEDPWARMRIGHDGLYFTGAELASAYPGFIEGAVRAGQEVAERLLRSKHGV